MLNEYNINISLFKYHARSYRYITTQVCSYNGIFFLKCYIIIWYISKDEMKVINLVLWEIWTHCVISCFICTGLAGAVLFPRLHGRLHLYGHIHFLCHSWNQEQNLYWNPEWVQVLQKGPHCRCNRDDIVIIYITYYPWIQQLKHFCLPLFVFTNMRTFHKAL